MYLLPTVHALLKECDVLRDEKLIELGVRMEDKDGWFPWRRCDTFLTVCCVCTCVLCVHVCCVCTCVLCVHVWCVYVCCVYMCVVCTCVLRVYVCYMCMCVVCMCRAHCSKAGRQRGAS